MIDFVPLIVKPRQARRLLSVSQKKLYEMINRGELESFLDGAARKITTASINAYIARGLEKPPQRRAYKKK